MMRIFANFFTGTALILPVSMPTNEVAHQYRLISKVSLISRPAIFSKCFHLEPRPTRNHTFETLSNLQLNTTDITYLFGNLFALVRGLRKRFP